jgi:acetylornithine/N-succinyldiaminopimelate aminotransferase
MDFNEIKKIQDEKNFGVFSRYDICVEKGKGCKLYDTQGKEYTDFFGGIAVNCLGYGDKDVTGAIRNQAKKLIHISNLFYNEKQAELTKLLTGGCGFDAAFFCNSGAEANEAAIKLARKYFYKDNIDKFKIICTQNSFHGRTLTTATATGQHKYSDPFRPLTPGFIHVPFNDTGALKEALKDGQVCAVMLECIQGEGGVVPASKEYLQAARDLTQEAGALLIIDEVQTGIMRCGKMFCFENYGITPDIVTLAKGLGGGFPIGAMLARGKAAQAFAKGDHGSTFGGNPLACAAACAVLKKVNNKEFAARVKYTGEYFLKSLEKLEFIGEARGMGLMVGLPLGEKTDGKKVVAKMLEKGFIINCAGGNTLRFTPPLIIGEREIDAMTDALKQVLEKLD